MLSAKQYHDLAGGSGAGATGPAVDPGYCLWLYAAQPSGASTPDRIPVSSLTTLGELSDEELVDGLMGKNDDLMRRLAQR